MIFRSKVDNFFVAIISILILLIGLGTLLPLFIDKNTDLIDVIVMSGLFIFLEGIVVWTSFSIQYVFYDDFLFVRGGPFRSKIPYQKITMVSQTNDIFTGYRILSSKQGLEIFNSSTIFGSVKISPKNKKEFIDELKKRCPNVHRQE
ncbi:PH domain-containing protein [Lysinibacillus sp. 54212]|uniref:PH domain-containing protein n=1 Tax=Lysinibacillus sp. 54212 TaxID=3119829 RepID=UPI002FCB6043